MIATEAEAQAPVPLHPPAPLADQRKVELLARIRTLYVEGHSLQAIANQLNPERVPTLSGRGSWKKGTIGSLLGEEG